MHSVLVLRYQDQALEFKELCQKWGKFPIIKAELNFFFGSAYVLALLGLRYKRRKIKNPLIQHLIFDSETLLH